MDGCTSHAHPMPRPTLPPPTYAYDSKYAPYKHPRNTKPNAQYVFQYSIHIPVRNTYPNPVDQVQSDSSLVLRPRSAKASGSRSPNAAAARLRLTRRKSKLCCPSPPCRELPFASYTPRNGAQATLILRFWGFSCVFGKNRGGSLVMVA
jgi:hypothetical protein